LANYNTLQFYLDRANQAREEAEMATLSHVRDRCLRSEVAWTHFAERAAATELKRQHQQALKAAEPPTGK
jgi:hypothetical protein